jgi:hypothetical protein
MSILSRLQNQLGRLEVLSIQCIIGPLEVHYALYDWGASVSIMSKMVYDYLNEDLLVPVSWCLQLTNSMKVQPYGLVKDVLIEIWGSSTLVDFLVVDMDPRQQTPVIYGAPFLKSVKGKGNHQHEG